MHTFKGIGIECQNHKGWRGHFPLAFQAEGFSILESEPRVITFISKDRPGVKPHDLSAYAALVVRF